MGLFATCATGTGERLTGGVSSDIWRIDLTTGSVCVKRALAKLRVAADWQAPVERNRFEARWMQRANAAVPGAAPRLLGLDEAAGALAMQFLPPDRYTLWKPQLRDGDADRHFAAQVAPAWHASTPPPLPTPPLRRLPHRPIFYDIRLNPIWATASAHPDLALNHDSLPPLRPTSEPGARRRQPGRTSCAAPAPVFLDAEWLWWGDPPSISPSASTTSC
jgi:hypothetical protein